MIALVHTCMTDRKNWIQSDRWCFVSLVRSQGTLILQLLVLSPVPSLSPCVNVLKAMQAGQGLGTKLGG